MRQVLGGGACRVGKVGTDLAGAHYARLLRRARLPHRCAEVGIVFEDAGELGIAIAIESQKPLHGVFDLFGQRRLAALDRGGQDLARPLQIRRLGRQR